MSTETSKPSAPTSEQGSQGSPGEEPVVRHVFDGIEEHDNRLPNWWLGILWTTIVFSFGYWFYYEVTHTGADSLERYQSAVAEYKKRQALTGPLSDEGLLELATDDKRVGEGKLVFAGNCLACHGAKGEGLIGPNLTDRFWIHGSTPTAIHKSVAQGFLDKGMPAWDKTLGAERVKSVVAFVLTLKNTEVPGRPPQGEPEGAAAEGATTTTPTVTATATGATTTTSPTPTAQAPAVPDAGM